MQAVCQIRAALDVDSANWRMWTNLMLLLLQVRGSIQSLRARASFAIHCLCSSFIPLLHITSLELAFSCALIAFACADERS
jgi:hypothetical protein